ncbi:carboxypeptidase regulatory-like domain-containing protein, partial [Candidatus Woesearchaeota archaeon]|nr:carboxypeptidase regulatory-like domain-containing protein [Candidatus Woesearchaeota archaeon]
MKYKIILSLVFILAILSCLSAYVSASCCVNEQTTFASVTNDLTCTDNLPMSACPAGYNLTVASCSAVPECGCCVCTPSAGGRQVFTSGDLRVSDNFCAAFCQQAAGDSTHQLISGLTAAQCSGQVSAQSVSGRVTDQSGNPVIGATVITNAGSTTTDTGGFYTINVLSQVTSLNVTKSGISTSIQVDTRIRTTGWNVTLTLAAQVADLYGKVTPIINNVPSTTPIQNVKISITDGTNTFDTVTDAIGEYRFIGVPLSQYQLTANKCAYYKKQENVQVTAPTTRKDILLQPAPAEMVSGTVRDIQNRMIEGVDFIVIPAAGTVTKSDANGRFQITNLNSNCQYSIKATKTPQYSEQTKVVNIYADDTVTTNSVNFVLTPGAAFDFCADISDCRGEDMVLGTSDDCGCPVNKVCNGLTGRCDERPIADCCDFAFQCQPATAKLAPTPQCSGKITCANTCAEIIACPADKKLSNANVDGVCECSGELVSVTPSIADLYDIPLASGKYCCPFASDPVSNITCKALNNAIVFGEVTSKLTKQALDAEIYIDGTPVPVTYSNAETGEFEIYLNPDTAHTIQFKREPLYLPVTRTVQAYNLQKGVRYRLDVEMRTVEILCNYPTTPPVPDFEAEHIKCKPEVRLRWNKDYCRNDLGVQSFIILNNNDESLYSVDKDQDEFVIKNLEWGEVYQFSIFAVYADSNRPRLSDAVTVSFTPGDEECAGRCDDDEFCLSNTERRLCDDENKLSSAVSPGSFADCAE